MPRIVASRPGFVPDIVVMLADSKRPRRRLEIDQVCLQPAEGVAPRADHLLQTGAKNTAEELIELFAVPPPVHVGFPQSQRTLGQHASEHRRVVDLEVPRPLVPHANAGGGEELLGPGT